MSLRNLLSVLCAGALFLSAAALAEPATAPPKPGDPMQPGYHPASDTDEAGLWMMNDKAEDTFKTSPLLVRDAALNAYVRSVMCKLAKDQCADMRLYILDIPYFNAAMAPNGAMQVWTGLLLRAQNEAQLACVLGHEISHYTLRHTLAEWRRAVNTSGAMAVLGIVTAGAGVGLIGLAADYALLGSMMSFSRDEEREADAHGQDLVAAAGYDPAQCAALWQEQMAEEDAEPEHKDGFLFLRTHPANKERLATMQSRAAALPAPAAAPQVDAEALLQATHGFRAAWLGEELNRSHYGQSLILVQALLAADPKSGELQFYLAEVYRRRNEAGDAARAADEYKSAIAAGAPVSAFRGLGLTAMKSGDPAGARDAFQHYLDAAPAADDRAMVEYYIAHLGDHT
ncbi:MAG: M48 family metalloprotease [Rhizomicrobium sp.]